MNNSSLFYLQGATHQGEVIYKYVATHQDGVIYIYVATHQGGVIYIYVTTHQGEVIYMYVATHQGEVIYIFDRMGKSREKIYATLKHMNSLQSKSVVLYLVIFGAIRYLEIQFCFQIDRFIWLFYNKSKNSLFIFLACFG